MKILLREPVTGIREKSSGRYMVPLRPSMLPAGLLSVGGYIRKTREKRTSVFSIWRITEAVSMFWVKLNTGRKLWKSFPMAPDWKVMKVK